MTNMNAVIVEAANRHIGTKEWPGAKSNPAVEVYFSQAGFPGVKDDVPWCAAFVGAVLAECGLHGSGSLMARSYLKWGRKVSPQEAGAGDIAVIARGKPPSGHVFIVVDIRDGIVHGVGGNQGDSVSTIKVGVADVLGFRRADVAAQPFIGRATLRLDSQGAMVGDLQYTLTSLGYFAGKIDGDFGPLTQAAVLAFQADAGIETDGEVGPITWNALDNAKPRPARDVDAADLRKRGSTTLASADKIDVAAGAAGVTATLTAVKEATDQAVGIIPTLQTLLVNYWPLLLVGALLIGVVFWSQKIKTARVNDARTGAHLGR